MTIKWMLYDRLSAVPPMLSNKVVSCRISRCLTSCGANMHDK